MPKEADPDRGSHPSALPLSGVTVVEICHSVAGPFGGVILAELGADVIKVEDPRHGDHARAWGPPYSHGTSTVFQALNRDKQGIVVDLRNQEEVARLRSVIIERADVVLQNLRPGSINKTLLSPESLMQAKPALIYCNLGAFGAGGPLAQAPGYDPLMQAFGGLMSLTGEPDGGPVRIGPAVVDMGSGMWAAIGILAALNRRHATGRGCIVDTSLYETAIAWVTIQMAGHLATGELRRPMGSGVAEIVPHQAFMARDGHIMVAAGNDRLFQSLCKALGHPEWGEDPRFSNNDGRVRNREALITLLEGTILTLPCSVWAERFDAHGVPNAPIQRLDQVAGHPQTRALEILQSAPDVDMALVGVPLRFDGVRPPFRRSAPGMGEHSVEILGAPAGLCTTQTGQHDGI